MNSSQIYNYNDMRRITLLLPVFNDWESLKVLLNQIEKSLNNTNLELSILIINDNSTEKCNLDLSKNTFF